MALTGMSIRLWVLTGLALSLGSIVTWTLISPFPSSRVLLDEPLPALSARFGPPNGSVPTSAVPWHPAKSLAWEKSRGIAVWTLEVDWDKTSPSPTTPPAFVSQSLRILGTHLSVSW